MDITIQHIAIQGVIALPFLSFLFFTIFGKKINSAWLSTCLLFISCLFSAFLFHQTWIENQTYQIGFEWFTLKTNAFNVNIWIDKTTTAMFLMVSFISTLVHLFSITYMKGDKYYSRYFALLGLFTFAMQALLLTSNLLIIYIFWELVGFCSYLLIGFWYEKSAAARAAQKAFLFNRVGDIGFLLAVSLVWFSFQTLDIQQITQILVSDTHTNHYLLILLGLGFVLATCGKSAQLPLSVWLPDAMEAPTPVSALIHAATMVAAGIYLLIRVHALLVPEIQLLVVIIGTLTALSAAFSALSQTDIKKVLAYSTVSQLGFMLVATGVGATQVALFHLLTHAFFKAGLFLCAGAIIHALHEQDMRKMGNLRKKMPLIFISYSLCACSLAGIPLFSGFLSKDLILHQSLVWAENHGLLFYLIPVSLFLTSLLTAIYITKQWSLVFLEKKDFLKQPQPKIGGLWQQFSTLPTVYFPILILAIFSLGFAFSINPFLPEKSWLMGGQIPALNHGIAVVSALLAGAGIAIGWWLSKKESSKETGESAAKENFAYKVGLDSFYQKTLVNCSIILSKKLAKFDDAVVDRTVRFAGFGLITIGLLAAWADKYVVDGGVRLSVWAVRKGGQKTKSMQNGKVQSYFAWAMVGMVVLLIFIVYL